jgi:exopolysaccharide biosynthesis protein
MALGGGPVLIRDGEQQESSDHKSHQQHPRAAIGWNSQFYYLVAIDGRQPGLSIGMTLEEVSRYLSKLGCDQAMNLDGGGSVELWIEGRIMNRPCFGRERHTGNSLVLLQSPQAPADESTRASR